MGSQESSDRGEYEEGVTNAEGHYKPHAMRPVRLRPRTTAADGSRWVPPRWTDLTGGGGDAEGEVTAAGHFKPYATRPERRRSDDGAQRTDRTGGGGGGGRYEPYYAASRRPAPEVGGRDTVGRSNRPTATRHHRWYDGADGRTTLAR